MPTRLSAVCVAANTLVRPALVDVGHVDREPVRLAALRQLVLGLGQVTGVVRTVRVRVDAGRRSPGWPAGSSVGDVAAVAYHHERCAAPPC